MFKPFAPADLPAEDRAVTAPRQFDLLEDPQRGLHAVLTRYGIASRSDFQPLVTALVHWAADAYRSSTPSRCAHGNEVGACSWCDLRDDGGLPEARAVTAPQEQEGCINCGEANDGGYMSGFEGDADEGAVGPFCSQCWELMRETFERPRPEQERIENLSHSLVAAIERAIHAETQVEALTHAIEALRGQWRDDADRLEHRRGQMTREKRGHEVLSACADALAAILKEWEGRH